MEASKSPPDDPLPGILAEIASLIGRDAALKIAGERGGTRVISHPSRLHRNHWLVQLIGSEPARHLCRKLTAGAGCALDIPHGPTGDRATRQRLIDTLILSGAPLFSISNQVGVDRTTVRRRKARLRALGAIR